MSKRGKRRKANHLHFVPLCIKQDMMNSFHSQRERRLGACFLPKSQWCGFSFCIWEMCMTDEQAHQITFFSGTYVKLDSCRLSLQQPLRLCTVANKVPSELVSAPFTARLAKCGKRYRGASTPCDPSGSLTKICSVVLTVKKWVHNGLKVDILTSYLAISATSFSISKL